MMVRLSGVADEFPSLQDHVVWGPHVFSRTSDVMCQLQTSQGSPLHLEQQGLQGLTSAHLSNVISFLCPFLPLFQTHWYSLSQSLSCLLAFA